MEVREHRDELVRRVRLMAGVVTACLIAIATTFWFVQIVHGSYYRGLAEHNRLRKQSLTAPRGLIYDRNGRLLVENIPSYNLLLDRSRAESLDESLLFAAQTLGQTVDELREVIARDTSTPIFQPVALAEDLGLAEVARFGVKALEHPEFEIEVRHLRLYRHGPQTAHVLGYLGEVTEADLSNSDYTPGDLVGKRGIEQAYDKALRGDDGEREVVVDSQGRVLEEYRRQSSAPGQSLTLSLDLELQQEAERLMEGKMGAIVALDPKTGEILTLLSAPSFNPNLFARRLASEQWSELVTDERHPLQDRTLQSTYSPGSLFKIVVAAAGLAEGLITEHKTVWCGGSTKIYDRRFRCWKQAGHGWVDLRESIERSCDVYFYQLGQQLGIERIARYSRLFGLGRPTGVDVIGEKAGLVPDPEWSQRVRGHTWYPGETISVAIGQGPLLTTPLQIAELMATVANGGRRIHPHLVLGDNREAGETLDLPASALAPVRDALFRVVNAPGGTAARAKVEGWDVAGKTGTVQVISQATWTDNESLPFEKRDHAWFASFAPVDDPRLVIVVFVEHGGAGSKAAAPIARALYEKYFAIREAEGSLAVSPEDRETGAPTSPVAATTSTGIPTSAAVSAGTVGGRQAPSASRGGAR